MTNTEMQEILDKSYKTIAFDEPSDETLLDFDASFIDAYKDATGVDRIEVRDLLAIGYLMMICEMPTPLLRKSLEESTKEDFSKVYDMISKMNTLIS